MKKRIVVVGLLFLAGCIAPRLGKKAVRYDNVERTQTPESVFIPIYASRKDVPFFFIVIGEVQAAPPRAERDFGYEPIELLREQARELGGIALLEVKSGDDFDSQHSWKGKVIVKK